MNPPRSPRGARKNICPRANRRSTASADSRADGRQPSASCVHRSATILTLCAVFAHPDDEAFGFSGTLARYVDAGVHVSLVVATSGEAGETVDGPVEKHELAHLREEEMRRSAGAIGAHEVRFLRLPDGGLSGRAEDLLQSVRAALEEIRPDVVICEDIRGITGHQDHIAVTEAVKRAAGDLGQAGPLKLYEHVERGPMTAEGSGLHFTPQDYITASLDIGSWKARKLASMRAHRSQIPEERVRWFESSRDVWTEHFICVYTRVPILIPENDLFSGIPEHRAHALDAHTRRGEQP